MRIHQKHINILVVVIFILIISSPLLVQLSQTTNHISTKENRKKIDFPTLKKDSIPLFFKDINNYYKDNFGLRIPLSNMYLQFKYHVLKESPKPSKVIVGKNGFFFLGTDFSNVIKESYGKEFFSKSKLENRKKVFEERINWLKKQGISYYVVIVPNKHTLYKEYFPYKYSFTKNRKQQWIEYMSKYGLGEHIIDLEKYLRAKKTEGLLYRKLDSHWNEMGAFYAYQAIIDYIDKNISIKKRELGDYNIIYENIEGGNTNMINLSITEKIPTFIPIFDTSGIREVTKSYYKKDNIWEHRTANSDKTNKILFFRDSFSSALLPFFSQTYGKCTFIWRFKFDKELILDEKPNIVIIECVERYLEEI